jgi:transcriptional regulator with GAF, ATPase, and Fis domain
LLEQQPTEVDYDQLVQTQSTIREAGRRVRHCETNAHDGEESRPHSKKRRRRQQAHFVAKWRQKEIIGRRDAQEQHCQEIRIAAQSTLTVIKS